MRHVATNGVVWLVGLSVCLGFVTETTMEMERVLVEMVAVNCDL